MEEGPPIVAVPSKSLQELAIEGQRALEAIVEAAHETLASMNEVLCNAALWSTSSAATAVAPASLSLGAGTQSSGSSLAAVGDPLETAASKAGGEGSSQQEGGWGALDEARLRLRLSATSLKAVIASVFSSPQMREQEGHSVSPSDNLDPADVEKLEQRVSFLREEVKNKNKVVKLLIDQLRELIKDISMWQSPGL